MTKFNMRKMMDTIVRYHCNELWLVPRMLGHFSFLLWNCCHTARQLSSYSLNVIANTTGKCMQHF